MPPSQSDPRHTGAIGSSFLNGTYHAICTCGWSGVDRDTMREAAADSTAHLDRFRIVWVCEACREETDEPMAAVVGGCEITYCPACAPEGARDVC